MTVPRSFLLISSAGRWGGLVSASRGGALEGRRHDAVAVDLLADDDKAGWQDYLDVAVSAAGSRTDVVVVGQSMGAFTASLLPNVLPDRYWCW